MDFEIRRLKEEDVPFVSDVYTENMEILHGSRISLCEWYEALVKNSDPDEINYIITVYGENAAWLKINGIKTERIYISMLVVLKRFQRMGIGSFAVRFAEAFGRENEKSSVLIHTTIDNTPAIKCYVKQGYKIERHLWHTLNYGVEREGIEFIKNINL